MNTRKYTSDVLRASGIALLALCLAAGAVPVGASARLSARVVASAEVAAGGRVVVHAEGQGAPWLSFGDGATIRTTSSGFDKAGGGFGEARTLASGDFDEDGTEDLVAAYASGSTGTVVAHFGNADALYPNSPAARERLAGGASRDGAFLAEARATQIPVAPDFFGAGDFDADGHLDLVAAQRGGESLFYLRGNGRGDFDAPQAVQLPGALGALATGDHRLSSGVGAVAVGVSAADGAKLLVFGGPSGALHADAVSHPLPAAATDMVFAHLDEDARADVAVAAGRSLVVVSGLGQVAAREFGASISSLAAGSFAGASRQSLALLSEDGVVSVATAPRAGSVEKVAGWEVERVASGVGAASRLAGASIDGNGSDDLLVVDKGARSVRVVSAGREANLAVDGEPVAVAAMRLNGDSVRDLVVLASGQDAPATVLSKLRVTITVTSAADSGANTLRQAIIDSNTSVGVTDVITFAIGSGAQTINLLSPLDPITHRPQRGRCGRRRARPQRDGGRDDDPLARDPQLLGRRHSPRRERQQQRRGVLHRHERERHDRQRQRRLGRRHRQLCEQHDRRHVGGRAKRRLGQHERRRDLYGERDRQRRAR
jgi:hypothetical protein